MHVPSRSSRCCCDATPLRPGSSYFSILVEKKGEWVRQDFCAQCRPESSEGYLWQGIIPLKVFQKNTTDQRALSYFHRCYADPEKHPLAYLLALYLERTGSFVRAGAGLFEQQETGEVFTVTSVPLSAEDASQVYEYLEKDAPLSS